MGPGIEVKISFESNDPIDEDSAFWCDCLHVP